MKQRKLRITYKIDADEHRELWIFAAYKHIAGQYPEDAFSKEAAFAWMLKYPIPEAKRQAFEAKYYETFPEARAVQPETNEQAKSGAAAGTEQA